LGDAPIDRELIEDLAASCHGAGGRRFSKTRPALQHRPQPASTPTSIEGHGNGVTLFSSGTALREELSVPITGEPG
jgi:hypothetical protein